jgi:hypothetical protein
LGKNGEHGERIDKVFTNWQQDPVDWIYPIGYDTGVPKRRN